MIQTFLPGLFQATFRRKAIRYFSKFSQVLCGLKIEDASKVDAGRLQLSTVARHICRTFSSGIHKRRMIDLSICIENEDVSVSDPPVMIPKIEYIGHKESVPMIQGFFEGLSATDLPDGEAWAIERINLTTHNGTHLDAPYHFHSTTKDDNGNKVKAKTIDEIPLEWCFANGVKLDFRHFENGYIVQPDDIQRELDRIGYDMKPLDIVLVNTSAGQLYGSSDYVNSGCGMGRDATLWLLDKGVKITGTDAWSWDAPFIYTAEKFAKQKDASIIWEGHKVGKDKEYLHIEKLNNLEQLPSFGFTISCFPVKIKGASAGWIRAVAMLDD